MSGIFTCENTIKWLYASLALINSAAPFKILCYFDSIPFHSISTNMCATDGGGGGGGNDDDSGSNSSSAADGDGKRYVCGNGSIYL